MKQRNFSGQCSGFTLLELSIVLAIVGLIAGAIVGMQSYVRTSSLTTSVEEARYYMNAFDSFQTTYGAVPGDMSNASSSWSAASNGDGNGYIRAVSSNNAEYFYAFQHLVSAELITGYYSGAAGSGSSSHCVPGTNIPLSSVDGVGFLFDHPDAATGIVAAGDALYFAGNYSHVIRMAAIYAADTGVPTRYFLTPKEGYELDAKYDDGLPGQGWIVTPEMSTATNCNTSDTAASSAYAVTNNDVACYFIFKM
jgi:prepilin-type N-terminal cleavage/methylation domain-containing protein